jgi:hypothetical protein
MQVETLRRLDRRLLAPDRGISHFRFECQLGFRRGRLALASSYLAASCRSIAGKLIQWINFRPGSYSEHPLIQAVQISAATS